MSSPTTQPDIAQERATYGIPAGGFGNTQSPTNTTQPANDVATERAKYGIPAEGFGTQMKNQASVQQKLDELDKAWNSKPSSGSTEDPNTIKVGGVPIVGGMVGNALKSGYESFKSNVEQASEGFSQVQKGANNPEASKTSSGFGQGFNDIVTGTEKMAGGGIGAGFSPLTGILKSVADATGIHPVELLKQLGTQIEAQASGHPDTYKSTPLDPDTQSKIDNAVTIITSLMGGSKTGEIAPAIEKTGEVLNTAKETVGNIKEKVLPTPTTEELTGKVLQGKTGDIAKGKSGLSLLDTSKVKTYSDLNTTASGKISELAKKQDTILSQDKTPRPIDSFEKTVGMGDSAVKINYVKQAIDNLKELYTNTSDAKGLSELKTIESKVNGEGLTIQEVNQLARDYGSEFGSKAFGKTGEPLTSVNAQRYENIRTGLKNTARDLMPDKESKALDDQMTDLYTVKRLSGNMAEKVNTLTQRLQKPNILQKLGGIIGKTVRITGVGDLASKLLGIDKVPGASTLNAVELEARLSKNLQKINAALAKDDNGFIADIKDMASPHPNEKPPK